MIYVQYGCGLSAPEGWLNFDISPTASLQKIPVFGRLVPGPRFPRSVRQGDIVKGLPLKDGSVDVLYCSHVLEHLSLTDFRMAMKNSYKVLRPGGTFRFVLPDLKHYAREYLAASHKNAAHDFMVNTYLGEPARPKGLSGMLRSWLGNSAHRWMWDYEGMEAELANAGFVSIRRAQMGDGGDPNFARVEDERRWTNCLGVHCVKPDLKGGGGNGRG
jgi:SAM-dependent methyltransferase